jgi:hypothetical protein
MSKIPKKQFNPIIQTTYNYGQFKIINGNRSVNQAHLKRLKESMSENPLVSLILVNERNEIIDGQHRFYASKNLGLPINYVIVYGYGIKEVQILNVNGLNWKKSDYLDSHVKNKLEAYVKFKKFMTDFPQLNFSTCLKVLSGLRSDKTKTIEGLKVMSTHFEDGTLSIPDLAKSYRLAEMILDFREYYPKFNHNTFIITLLYLFDHPNYVHREMLNKLKIQPKALNKCNNQQQYLILMEDIYNYHRKAKVSFRY